MRDFPAYKGPMALWPQVEVIEGVQDALHSLQNEFLLALATNAADSEEVEIWRALARGGLESYIQCVYNYRKILSKKPSLDFFRYILNDLTLPQHQVFMVGDDFAMDIMGANQAGIRAVWLNIGGMEDRTSPYYRTIHHFSQLPGKLNEMLAGI